MKVYCQTCQRHLAQYVLGRGYVPLSKKKAAQRAEEHRVVNPGHVVVVAAESKEK